MKYKEEGMKRYSMREFNSNISRVCKEAEKGLIILTKQGKDWLVLQDVATLEKVEGKKRLDGEVKGEDVATLEVDGTGEKLTDSRCGFRNTLTKEEVETLDKTIISWEKGKGILEEDRGEFKDMWYNGWTRVSKAEMKRTYGKDWEKEWEAL